MEGKEVSWMPSYGPKMRGGTVNCTVIIFDNIISSPIVTETEVLVALFINSSLVRMELERDDIISYYVDGNEIAREIGSGKFAYMVMLGAIVRKTRVVSLESVEKVMERMFTGDKAKFLPMNK